MNPITNLSGLAQSRRQFLSTTTKAAAVSTLAGLVLPAVHAAGGDTIQVALVGCGGRGTGAAQDALNTKSGPMKLVAVADVFENRLRRAASALSDRFKDQADVPEERQFLGFDGYKKAMDCLKPGDVVILTTPPAFRWVHFSYAIQKGLNVFMEKPVTVDGPTTKRMLKLGAEAEAKNLKVGVGLMVRHCRARRELHERIEKGEIGDVILMRAYRMAGASATALPKPPDMSETLYQIQRFHAFLWASGGMFSDYFIHQIDECSWMKNGWPVKAQALGGRHYRGKSVDQNLDTYSVEYTFADGSKFFYEGRTVSGCQNDFASYAHGAKGCAVISTAGHTPGRVRIYNGQNFDRANLAWSFPQPEKSPYQLEWDDLVEAIRQNKPYNEVRRGAEASLVTSMGRMAAHTGQVITFDQMLECEHEFAPGVDKLTNDGPAPVLAGPDGRYPVPQPGLNKQREY